MVRSVDIDLMAEKIHSHSRACLAVAGSRRTVEVGLDPDMVLDHAEIRQSPVGRIDQAVADRTVPAAVGHSTEVLVALRRSLAAAVADSRRVVAVLADNLGLDRRMTELANRSPKAQESRTDGEDIDRMGQT